MLSRSIGAVLLTAAISLSGAASAQEARLRGGVFVPLTSAFGDPCKRFVDELNNRGKGQVQAQLLGPEAMPPFELGNAVSGGVLDLACVPPAYYKSKMVEGEATVFSNISFLEHRKTGAWELLNQIHNEKMNVWYLAGYGDGVKFHFYVNKEVKSPDDFKGMRFRSAPNYLTLLQSLGATPLQLPPGEVYTALERGTAEAYGWPLWGIHDLGWDKFTKVRIDPGFSNVGVHILVNLNKWKSLTDPQRQVLTEAAVWLETNFPKWQAEISARDAARQAASGIKVVDFGPEWAKRANDAYYADVEKASPENMRKLRPLISK